MGVAVVALRDIGLSLGGNYWRREPQILLQHWKKRVVGRVDGVKIDTLPCIEKI